MPSSHLILCRPLFLLPPIPPSILVLLWVLLQAAGLEAPPCLTFQVPQSLTARGPPPAFPRNPRGRLGFPGLRGTLGSSLRSPAEGEGNKGFPPQPEKDLESPSSTPLEGNPAGLSSCSGGLRPLVELCVSSVLAREGAGCGSVGDVPGAWLASAPLSPSLWT